MYIKTKNIKYLYIKNTEYINKIDNKIILITSNKMESD